VSDKCRKNAIMYKPLIISGLTKVFKFAYSRSKLRLVANMRNLDDVNRKYLTF
jgi:hypothetical protein